MSYYVRRPAASLRPIVDRLWHVDESCGALPETICPDGRPEIVLHLGDPMAERVGAQDYRQPRHLLVGQMTSPITVVATGRIVMVGARLAPDALHRLTRMPQTELTGRVIELESVWARWARLAAHRLSLATGAEQRLMVFEQALQELVARGAPPRSMRPFGAAIARLEASAGKASVAALANDYGLSRRQFERCFREQVGLSPRLFGRIVRFQRAFQALGIESGAAIAARYGFADQAHLVHEIRRFAGQPPTALAEASGLTAFFRG
jgi:AraC-like DNA-binding protein